MAEEGKDVTTQSSQPPARQPRVLEKAGFTFLPKTWEDLYAYAKEIAQTDFVPNDMRGKPGAVLAAWQFGQEIGLAPMAALQSVAVINGRPSLWGDGALAIVRSNPLCEYIRELAPDEALAKGYGECTVKRHDDAVPITRRFTKAMAEQAGLWGGKSQDAAKKKFEPWFNYPGRMLQMRARAWAMRDAIPEALRGISIREEIEDAPRDVTPESSPRQIQTPQPLMEKVDELQTQDRVDRSEDRGSEAGDSQTLGSDRLVANGEAGGTVAESSGVAVPKEKALSLPTLQERTAWVNQAMLEELADNKNFALNNMKNLTQGEQAAICRLVNDRKQALLKAQGGTSGE